MSEDVEDVVVTVRPEHAGLTPDEVIALLSAGCEPSPDVD